MAEVRNLFICVGQRAPMLELAEVDVKANFGIVGCRHARAGSDRQVLIMDSETVAALNLAPGTVRENITTSGIDLKRVAVGQHLILGQVLLEIADPCHPCRRMDEIRAGLRAELQGRRGWLCRVLEGGRLRPRNIVEVVATARASIG